MRTLVHHSLSFSSIRVPLVAWIFLIMAARGWAGPCLFNPAPTTLEPARLAEVVAEWDRLVKDDLLEMKIKAFSLVTLNSNVSSQTSERILKYNNPEIQQRVIDLYKREWDKEPHSYGHIDSELEKTDPWHGADYGYMQWISGLAESTFSPQIYEYELTKPGVQPLREVYLAMVQPEMTIDRIVGSDLGVKLGKPAVFDLLFDKKSGAFLLDLPQVFDIFMYMAQFTIQDNPELKKKILPYVRSHALHYSKQEQERIRKRFESTAMDERIRGRALGILELIGEKQDVELVQRLKVDMDEKFVQQADQVAGKLRNR